MALISSHLRDYQGFAHHRDVVIEAVFEDLAPTKWSCPKRSGNNTAGHRPSLRRIPHRLLGDCRSRQPPRAGNRPAFFSPRWKKMPLVGDPAQGNRPTRRVIAFRGAVANGRGKTPIVVQIKRGHVIDPRAVY